MVVAIATGQGTGLGGGKGAGVEPLSGGTGPLYSPALPPSEMLAQRRVLSAGSVIDGTALESGIAASWSAPQVQELPYRAKSPSDLRRMTPEKLLDWTRQSFNHELSTREVNDLLEGIRLALDKPGLSERSPDVALELVAYHRAVKERHFGIAPDRDAMPFELMMSLANNEPARQRLLERLSECPLEVQRHLSPPLALTEKIPSGEELRRSRRDPPPDRTSQDFKRCLERARAAGFPEEMIDRASLELNGIIDGCMKQALEWKSKYHREPTPKELCALIHNHLREQYGLEYAYNENLLHGLATHQLDCDTTSYIFAEVGRSLGYNLKVATIVQTGELGSDGKRIAHAIVVYINPDTNRLEFGWEATHPHAVDPRNPVTVYLPEKGDLERLLQGFAGRTADGHDLLPHLWVATGNQDYPLGMVWVPRDFWQKGEPGLFSR